MVGESSPVAEWYRGKNVFITGATGFMGKVMVEKLLYACTGIKSIYILIRHKRGKSPQQRIQDMWQLPMFERLRKSQPNAIHKIVPLCGDVNSDGLGLARVDTELLINNVNVVFHMAATLKLEANLKDAIEQNTVGTARVIDVCKKIKNLEAFIHFSTAFCSADIDVFEERVYESKDDPRKVINVTDWLSSDILDKVTPAIISPHPNTYTYSKRLAETLIANELDNMPVCIIRPSIVIPSVEEPVPGWVDSLNGPIGLIVGAGKGVIRSMHCKGENSGQFIPVDYAINASIIIAQLIATSKKKPKEVPVYNLTQDALLKITYREIIDMGRNIAYEHPFEMQIWYPDGDIRSSKIIHTIYSIFFHWLPALLIDFLLLIFGQKRFMIRIQKKIHDGLGLLEFFSVREWYFKSERFVGLNDLITDVDKKMFTTADFTRIPIQEYLTRALLGTRQYCLKEDLSSLPRCRQKQKLLYVLHIFCVYGFYFYIFYLLSCYFTPVQRIFDTARDYLSYIPGVNAIIKPSSS
ncbi:putative fatty acyl-CoA reductase CG5065 [Anoplophora glabripennis]|uniref:putative fatty acyl-CoA reductase CG5065 n=1 Tax=Anoplophora glabripennis TaxID=217634 RepID=UPI0008758399|nr:putative fatty acyl-CoA reductase CG5065 [Anoplophora glabripennis]